MRRRLAVLGCSFSEYQTANGEPWSIHIAKNFDIEVHNYAVGGRGCLFADLVLNYIVSQSMTVMEFKYDACIVQMPPPGRWMLPIDTSPFLDFSEMIVPKKIDNYWVMFSDESRTRDNCVNLMPKFDYNKITINGEKVRYDPTGYPDAYSLYFEDTLHLYNDYFKNNLWHFHVGKQVVNPHRNNLGHEKSMLSTLHLNSGMSLHDWQMKYTFKKQGDSGHLNELGNKEAYEQYILPSPIGDWLNGTS